MIKSRPLTGLKAPSTHIPRHTKHALSPQTLNLQPSGCRDLSVLPGNSLPVARPTLASKSASLALPPLILRYFDGWAGPSPELQVLGSSLFQELLIKDDLLALQQLIVTLEKVRSEI